MLTSLAYCCSFCWQKIVSSRSATMKLKKLSFQGAEESSSSIIEQLFSSLLKTHLYPEPEKKRKKRKFKTNNGWRLILRKGKGKLQEKAREKENMQNKRIRTNNS